MASRSGSMFGSIRTAVSRAFESIWTTVSPVVEPVWTTLIQSIKYLTRSVFRFLIVSGFVLIMIGAIRWEGPVAAHLGIYGATALSIGVIGRFVVRSRIKEA